MIFLRSFGTTFPSTPFAATLRSNIFNLYWLFKSQFYQTPPNCDSLFYPIEWNPCSITRFALHRSRGPWNNFQYYHFYTHKKWFKYTKSYCIFCWQHKLQWRKRATRPKNVFRMFKKLNDKILPVGCSNHILHNSAQTACGMLEINVDFTIFSIISYFKGSTKRTKELSDFCDFVEVPKIF